MSDFPKDAPSIRDKDAPHKQYKNRLKKPNKKYTDSPEGDFYAPTIAEKLDDLLTDPLQELFDLAEAELSVLPKPDMGSELAANVESPNKQQFDHPVIKQRNEVDALIAQGMNPVKAHQTVYGETDPGNVDSKASLASTLGRLQDDGNRNAVKMEPEKQSLLYKDAEYDKKMNATTQDDLRTPMNQQVPDDQQTPADQVAENLDITEDCDYNQDVAYLQKYGRA